MRIKLFENRFTDFLIGCLVGIIVNRMQRFTIYLFLNECKVYNIIEVCVGQSHRYPYFGFLFEESLCRG